MNTTNIETKIVSNHSLAFYSSWRVGGPAEFFISPKNLEDLKQAVKWAQKKQLMISVLSGGTNCLISDQGVLGLVISMREMMGLESYEKDRNFFITAWAGTSKVQLMRIFLKTQLAPALMLSGLPGDVGGGVVMNAGVSEEITPKEFSQIVDWVEVLKEDQITVYKKNELEWSYRHCQGWQPGIITRVGFSWELSPIPNLFESVKQANQRRLSKQPLNLPNCGSVFLNPSHVIRAGALIDQCGLKGKTIGGAQVSQKHANFIVNQGGATAKDIWHLIELIQNEVKLKTHIELKTEIIFLGEFYHDKQ